ncbi:ribbon-helix-helix protein, CopG family [Lentibacillus sp. CBA3610]|uniref:ribbon-helix-helix protein, CopG family n=1 Tax=Lentibacillus sp. CBA3610 TaxID=2518176 RepID=UPI0015958BCB|nr:ribbon-helix-helix protein, CopG family [Lentibacillus sp. CBA3610]QKY71021.1 ribbon-helix-helix protein, CopG family [Lentibacillus sp. CBA3610]
MEYPMKRKQFHITEQDEKALKDLAQNKGLSEAEIVREAIREYTSNNQKKGNPLLEMASKAESYMVESAEDLSVNHDDYLQEIHDNEKQ